jgi:hypothetical protein
MAIDAFAAQSTNVASSVHSVAHVSGRESTSAHVAAPAPASAHTPAGKHAHFGDMPQDAGMSMQDRGCGDGEGPMQPGRSPRFGHVGVYEDPDAQEPASLSGVHWAGVPPRSE